MNMSIRLTAAAAISALFSLSSGGAQAASVTYNDETCDVFSGQTVAGVFTVSCAQRKSTTDPGTGTGGTGTGGTGTGGTGTGGTDTGGTTGGVQPGTACPGFTSTHWIKIDWGTGNKRVYTSNFGGFGNNDIAVVYFTTPAFATNVGISGGAIQAAESQSVAISRTAALSASPCSFDNNLGATGDTSAFAFLQKVTGAATATGNTVTVNYQLGGTNTYKPALQSNTTYYYNIKNTLGVGGNMVIDLLKPSGF